MFYISTHRKGELTDYRLKIHYNSELNIKKPGLRLYGLCPGF